MSKHWLIGMSIAIHGVIGAGAFVHGIWDLEKLEGERDRSLGLAQWEPPAPEGGRAGAVAKAERPKPLENKPRPRRPDVVVQIETQRRSEDPVETATRETEPGNGAGLGTGLGTDTGTGTPDGTCRDGTCVGTTAAAVTCGDGAIGTGEQCDDGNTRSGDGCSGACAIEAPKPEVLPPSVMGALRRSGDTSPVPPDVVKNEMLRANKSKVIGNVKVCIDVTGRTSPSLIKSTGYPAYDERLVAATAGWRYDPYRVNGKAVPACSVVTFVYTIQ